MESLREVSYEEGEKYAKKNNLAFFETSSKNNFTLRKSLSLYNLFDNSEQENAEFIGIITIKFYQKEIRKKKCWFLL